MDGSHSLIAVLLIDKYADLDLGSGDHLDVVQYSFIAYVYTQNPSDVFAASKTGSLIAKSLRGADSGWRNNPKPDLVQCLIQR